MRLQSLRKWQSCVRVGNERPLVVALSEIGRMAGLLSLPRNVAETASLIYRRALKKRLVRGRLFPRKIRLDLPSLVSNKLTPEEDEAVQRIALELPEENVVLRNSKEKGS